jgi:hypothetical protein
MAGMKRSIRFWGLLALALAVVVIVGSKAVSEGWFAPRAALDFNGEPALVFFSLSRGCDCQMRVVHSAEAQIENWTERERQGLPVLRVDLIQQPDLGEIFGIRRAPALVLVNRYGEVVWRQDESLSDEQPLDLAEAEWRIEALLHPSESGGG